MPDSRGWSRDAIYRRRGHMTIERAVMLLAGSMIMLSVMLTWLFSPYWLVLTAFVGLNLMQASITRLCPAAMIFKALVCEVDRRSDKASAVRLMQSQSCQYGQWLVPARGAESRLPLGRGRCMLKSTASKARGDEQPRSAAPQSGCDYTAMRG